MSVVPGAKLLSFNDDVPYFRLVTEDGCDVDGDDGLTYCAQNQLLIIFQRTARQEVVGSTYADIPDVSTARWPARYQLPRFDDWIRTEINNCTTRKEAIVLKKNKTFGTSFVRAIVRDIAKYTGKEM